MKDEQDGLREAYCETLRAEYAEKYRQLREEFERQLAERDEQLGPWTVQALRQYVADTSDGFKCLPGCDSFGHEELCPVTDTVQAFRLLRERLAERDARILELERILESDRIHCMACGGQTCHEMHDMEQQLKTARSALQRIHDECLREGINGIGNIAREALGE